MAASTVLLWPGVGLGSSIDSAVYVIAGSDIRAGLMPYRDLWDSKPPGAFLLNALGQSLLPWLEPWLVGWLLTVLFTGLSVLLVNLLLRRHLSAGAAWAWSLVACVVLASYPTALGGGLTESFAVLPLVAAMYVLDARTPTWRTAVVIGFLLSCACLCSLQCLPGVVCLGLASTWGDRQVRLWVTQALALIAGAISLPLAVVGWLVSGGAIGDAVDQVVVFNLADREYGGQLLTLLPVVCMLLFFFVVAAAVAVAAMAQQPRAFTRLYWSCLGWSVAYAAYIAYQGRLFLHFLILIGPPLVLLASLGVEELRRRLRSPRLWVRRLAFGAAAVATVALLVSSGVAVPLNSMVIDGGRANAHLLDQTETWIQAETPNSATMFVWGSRASLYLDAHRPRANRIVNDFPIVAAKYWTSDQTAALLEAWTASPPAIIVEGAATTPLLRPATAGRGAGQPDTVAVLRQFVRANYNLKASFGDDLQFSDIYIYAWTD
ncbi:MAG TPA: hypothetical protein VF337_05135 [Candidatus Limnocylindrales bacterium]